MKYIPLLFLFLFVGCAQIQPEDEELRTVPVTNNPDIIPHTAGFPGIPMGGPNL